MRSKLFLVALVILGGVVATANAETISNYTITPGIDGLDTEWAGGLYTADTLLDNGSGMNASADWSYIRIGNDASKLYFYVHYNNAGSLTINPAGSYTKYETIYMDTDNNASTGYSINGIGADVEITGIYKPSSGCKLGYATYSGSAWGTPTYLTFSSGGDAYYGTDSGTSYKISFEFGFSLSALGLTASPAFDWVAVAPNTYSGVTDYYPDAGSNHYGATVPEPSTFVLLAAGLAGLCAYAWRKRK